MAADDHPVIEKVWLRLDHEAQTAHLFSDYVKSRYGSFLAVHALCGRRRDERMRVPADLKEHRICLRCSRSHESQERRRAKHEESMRQYAEPARGER